MMDIQVTDNRGISRGITKFSIFVFLSEKIDTSSDFHTIIPHKNDKFNNPSLSHHFRKKSKKNSTVHVADIRLADNPETMGGGGYYEYFSMVFQNNFLSLVFSFSNEKIQLTIDYPPTFAHLMEISVDDIRGNTRYCK